MDSEKEKENMMTEADSGTVVQNLNTSARNQLQELARVREARRQAQESEKADSIDNLHSKSNQAASAAQ